MINRTHLVADNFEDVLSVDMLALTEHLTKTHGSRGLEFELVQPYVGNGTGPDGFAAIVSRQHPGFAILNITIDTINESVHSWCNDRLGHEIQRDETMG